MLIRGVASARRSNSSRRWSEQYSLVVVMPDDNVKIYPVEPGGNIQLENLPTHVRDTSMGRYMDAFGRLEGEVQLVTSLIIQIDPLLLSNVFAVLMTKQSIDLLAASAQSHLTAEGAERVSRICERLGRRNMRRNHIVHGRWVQAITAHEGYAAQEWVRWYGHHNPAARHLPHTDPKVAGLYAFTIPELDRATDHVEEMFPVLSTLTGDLPSLRLPPPPHEE